MPEYLTPGVYVEEVSFRSKSIEGVATSTTGFVAVTRFGPVRHAGGPVTNKPRLVTNYREYEEIYGGLDALDFNGAEHIGYSAHAVRAYFFNGGQRLYVSRVFAENGGGDDGVARRAVPVGGGGVNATYTARWPGSFGNVRVHAEPVRSQNIAYAHPNPAFGIQVQRAKIGAIVEIFPAGASIPSADTLPVVANLREVQIDAITGRQLFLDGGVDAPPGPGEQVVLVELRVTVEVNSERRDVYDQLGLHPNQTRYIAKILGRDHPEDENAVVHLAWDPTAFGPSNAFGVIDAAKNLLVALCNPAPRLTGGNDGRMPTPDELRGVPSDPDDPTITATGLEALGEIDDIAIVAAPDGSTYANVDQSFAAMSHLVAHAELDRFRIAVVDGPQNSSLSAIRAFRGRFDSTYGALYHPWIEIFDPTQRAAQGAPPDRILLPPSGFVTGVYARTDIRRGVHKAPANEVVFGLTQFEANINDGRQAVLNPEGINALRFFDGRGYRIWGARTMTSDPEWKYVNVRRLFIYLEHSIYRGTQWAVFEPNNERLWANVQETVSDFLYTLWRDGALMGTKPEQAYFVRCDRTTMSQNDLDNGRLICLVGIAPAKPAEFVIFRVGQWTGDAKQN